MVHTASGERKESELLGKFESHDALHYLFFNLFIYFLLFFVLVFTFWFNT